MLFPNFLIDDLTSYKVFSCFYFLDLGGVNVLQPLILFLKVDVLQ